MNSPRTHREKKAIIREEKGKLLTLLLEDCPFFDDLLRKNSQMVENLNFLLGC